MCQGDDPNCAAFAEHRRRFLGDLAPERRAFLKSGFVATGGAAALAAGGLSLVTPALAQTSAARGRDTPRISFFRPMRTRFTGATSARICALRSRSNPATSSPSRR